MAFPAVPDLDVEAGDTGHPDHHDAITALLAAVRTALGAGLPEQITAEAVADLTALIATGRLRAVDGLTTLSGTVDAAADWVPIYDTSAAALRKVAPVPAALLSKKSYNPTSAADVTTTSTTMAAIDATNLVLPDFVAPTSGFVLVRLSAYSIAGASTGLAWAIHDGSGLIAGSIVRPSGANSIDRGTASCVVAVTPGATITGWKWMHARAFGAGTCHTYYGGDPADVVAAIGPALMEVWSS